MTTPAMQEVQEEVVRANNLIAGIPGAPSVELVASGETQMAGTGAPVPAVSRVAPSRPVPVREESPEPEPLPKPGFFSQLFARFFANDERDEKNGEARGARKKAASKVAVKSKAAAKPAAEAAPAEAAAPAAEPEAAQAAAESQAADEPAAAVDGQKVYQAACQACHAAGVAGAPKLGDKEAWAPRIAKGEDALLASVNNGLNAMPPKGTCFACSDADLKAAIEYMVAESK